MPELKVCELCGKRKNINAMVEYYIAKRSNHHKVMYKCKNCKLEEAQLEEL